MFTKIDANLNNIEGLVIDIYPALYLYPKGFKEFPILFNKNKYDLKNIIEFT